MLGLPGPLDVLRDLTSLVPRAAALLDTATLLVARLDVVAGEAQAALRRVGGVLDGVETTVTEVRGVVAESGSVAAGAGAVVERAGGATDRVHLLLAELEPSLLRLAPVLQRLAETVEPDEVEAVVGLVDRLPTLLDAVDSDVLPLMRTLDSVGPDIHDLLLLVQELGSVLEKVPGMGLIKRRVDSDD